MRTLVQNERQTRLALIQLPQELSNLMRDDHGLGYLVQDPP
jgi:hypothetical protein